MILQCWIFITRFTSLLKEQTCIDSILTNKPHSFQNSYVIETGLSDFNRVILSETNDLLKT